MSSHAPGHRPSPTDPQLSVQLVGGLSAFLEYGGLRWLTDPALSPPGEYAGLTKRTIVQRTGEIPIAQGADELKAAFSGNGIRDRLLMLDRGQSAAV